ncbi:hypothetical protein PVK06_027984 [Gossypium arboreum]|uniref:Uncharacterized protein n=1 Tax=Gossypium arboreum TaxID=29729 RepID=A0ABR0P343_GOSAR|nr:hypothetical protein PVK06_027984 [Gossypium arboreum]
MKRLLRLIVLLILRTLITELSLKFWVLKGTVGFDFKDLVLPRPNFGSGSQQYMPSGSQAQAKVQRLRDQIAQMQANTIEQIAEVQRKYEELQQQLRAEAAAKEAEAAAMAAEESKKYDDL